MREQVDLIKPETARTLAGLFRERVRRTPRGRAYLQYLQQEGRWQELTWGEVAALAGRWQAALRRENLQPGERVAIMLKNSLEWVLFDLAAAGLGLVTVPLFVNDRPENFAHILRETEARLLLIEGLEQWQRVERVSDHLGEIQRIVTLQTVCEKDCDPRLAEISQWLHGTGYEFSAFDCDPQQLASIVYTSGTTGTPKGVMLSHANLLQNAYAGVSQVLIYPDDLFLSFLPLSHTLERTAGYYVPIMAGACVAHVRSVEQLPEDLMAVRPTIMISVPRIFERIHKGIMMKLDERPAVARKLFYLTVSTGWKRFLRAQGRDGWPLQLLLWPVLQRVVAAPVLARLGGRLRATISGGASLSPAIARVFLGMGVNVLQGYGLTETSPVIAVNTLEDNQPATVGVPLPGVEAKIAANGELLVRGPNVMLGYWKNPEATEQVIDRAGWFHTGDMAKIDDQRHITITGRIKEIIVLSTGEKVPPEDVEVAIVQNPLFEQAMVVGEGRPYLTALVVVNEAQWERLAAKLGVDPADPAMLNSEPVQQVVLAKISRRLARFPGYAQIKRVFVTRDPWTVNEGLITATLKIRRKQLLVKYSREVEALYAGH